MLAHEERCEAICSTHGQRCRCRSLGVYGGQRLCGHHRRLASPLDGDDERISRINDLLTEAMQHPQWPQTPGPVRHLIEHAWVELDRATDEDGE